MKKFNKWFTGMFIVMALCLAVSANVKAEIIDKFTWKGFVCTNNYTGEGSVVILSYKGNASKLVIPSEIKGNKVEAVYSLGKSKKIKELHISNGVEIVGSSLSACPNLKKITINKNNPDYIIKNGMLLTKDGHSLESCPGGMEYPEIPSSVTKISVSAFQGSGIKKLSLGKNITHIEHTAFADCKNLASVTFHKDMELKTINSSLFENCKSLKNVELPESVTWINRDVFNRCSNLETVTIGKNVTYIEDSIFSECPNLSSVYFYNRKCEIDGSVGRGYWWLINEFSLCQDKVVVYGLANSDIIKGAKKNGIKYEIIDSNKNVKEYKDFEYTISSAKNGKAATIINYTGKEKSITIPTTIYGIPVKTLDSLGASSYVKKVFIPNGIEVKGSALASCQKLETIQMSKNNPNYRVQGKILLSKDKKTLVACAGSVQESKIPNSVKNIADGAFSGSVIKKITIGKNVANMGYAVFKNCKKLTTVTFHKNTKVKIMKHSMFENCSALKKVIFPESVTEVWDYVFYGCTNLTTVKMQKKLKYVGFNMFTDCKKLREVYIYSMNCVIGDGYHAIVDSLYNQRKTTFYGKKDSTIQKETSGYMLIKFKVI